MSAERSQPRVSPGLLALEIVRPYALLAGYAAASYFEIWWLVLPLAIGLYMASFIQLHDTMHGSMGIPRRWNEFLMVTSALFLFKAAHGVQATHMQHHRLNLAEGDLEGTPARWSLWKALVLGPWYSLKMRFAAFGIASERSRRWMVAETGLNVVQVAACFYFGVVEGQLGAALYWYFVIIVTCLMPVWASWIPHHIPDSRLVRTIRCLGGELTPGLNSYFFHEEHHRFPKVPARDLYKA